jgi:hypothetical protein
MKICLISFDSKYFDHHIVNELKRQNIDANHIDVSKISYEYPSFFKKIINFFSKILLNKNLKQIEIEKIILKQIELIGYQDIIMIIRPDRISKKTHFEIKKQASSYITYIYDSCKRFPIDHLLNGVFNEIFSFDIDDSKKYGFTFITNYIYFEKKEIKSDSKNNYKAFIVMSADERIQILNKLADFFTINKLKFKFVLVGKKRPKNLNENIKFSNKTFLLSDYQKDIENSSILIDLIRFNHNGLSFRIFEALAYQKKIITSNKSIKLYDFYNPNNILVIEEKNIEIPIDFLETPYEPIPKDIYYKYTIQNWVAIVFGLN